MGKYSGWNIACYIRKRRHRYILKGVREWKIAFANLCPAGPFLDLLRSNFFCTFFTRFWGMKNSSFFKSKIRSQKNKFDSFEIDLKFWMNLPYVLLNEFMIYNFRLFGSEGANRVTHTDFVKWPKYAEFVQICL